MKKMQNSIFQKVMILGLAMLLNISLFAQGRIELKSNSRGTAQISESSLNGFETTFSYNAIELELVETEYGNFSKLILSDAVSVGEIGAPSLPVTKKLIAVPFGATPSVKIVSYTTSDYDLSDYGVDKVYPQQPSYSKDTKMENVVFQYDKKAYKTRALKNAPEVKVELLGTMRGVQIASLQVEPVNYNPVNNTLRVYNDINFEVDFEGADLGLTEKMLVDTYSPYFSTVYQQMFNSRTVADVFDEHPDLYRMPVYMTVVANSMFEETLKPWLEWKTQKGFYIDVKYVESTTSSSVIKSYVKEQYDAVRPSFLVIVGDKDLVAPSLASGVETSKVTDLYYACVDDDYFPDIYYSRMSCETVGELESLIEKVLQYEQYTMPDPSYLNDALFVAGVDDWWNSKVGTPAVNYATNFFFNQSNGMKNVYKYTSTYDGCYDNMNKGVGFVNYTAHGVETGWVDPAFNTDDVLNLTNKDKYFWAVGNCCLTGDWGSNNGPCLAEAMVRADEKGAWGYIGSCPVSYWNEDYYFAVGATTVFSKMPNPTQTEEGVYEMFWKDDYNVLSAVPFVGNLSVTNAHAGSYETTNGIELLYYWEAYHTIGDGTVMPYRIMPTENAVSHAEVINMGFDFYTVFAEPSSYVSITKDGVLLGTAMVGKSGSVDVEITPILTEGEATITVTHPRRIPYVKNVLALPTEGPYLSIYDFNPKNFPVNQENKITLTIRNVGNDPVEGEAKVTLTSESEFLSFVDSEAVFTTLEAGSTLDLTDEFTFVLDKSLEDMEDVVVVATIEYDTLEWKNKFAVKVDDPVIEYEGVDWDGEFEPGATYVLQAKFKNIGHYKAENAVVTASSSNEYVTLKNTTSEVETIEVDGVGVFNFEVTIGDSCLLNERMPIDFAFAADNDIVSEGSYVLENTCELVFTLKDSYGDGWGKSAIKIEFSDDTPTDTLTVFEGAELVKEMNVVIGTTIVVTFIKEKYNSYECSYVVEYKGGRLIYDSGKNIKEGVNCEFEVNCLEPVQNLKAEVEKNNVTLTWEAPRAMTGYKVFRNNEMIGETEELTFTDENVPNGEYEYSVRVQYNGGWSGAEMITVKVSGEDIIELGKVDFVIYPNPAKDVINIESNVQRYEYQLINNLGQIVLDGTLAGENSISVKDINNGIYFLKLIADGEMSVNRVIIQ
ncbi:MAG: T9SS type A sorting domain-containing protein [Bacteroidales bacterium]|nr:T9SS type A sorting domain-containing protein [Bacteroidales bacterium]